MIPKIIHYCWFGGNPKPDIVKQCIASWERFCPDWEIREWNESNFDVNAMPYTKEAYAAKKWAFVSDVARLKVISEYGGVYLDTDVELLTQNPFDPYLLFDNVLVFDGERSINTGLCFASNAGSDLSEKFLCSYRNAHYSLQEEIVNSRMNHPVILNEYPKLKWNAKTQVIGNTCILGCDEYNKMMKHYGTRSWCDNLPEYQVSGAWRIKEILRNPELFEFMQSKAWLRKVLSVYEFLVYDFLDLGPLYYIKRLLLKLRKK